METRKEYRIMFNYPTSTLWWDFVEGDVFGSIEECDGYMKKISERYPDDDDIVIKYQERDVSEWRDIGATVS